MDCESGPSLLLCSMEVSENGGYLQRNIRVNSDVQGLGCRGFPKLGVPFEGPIMTIVVIVF